jgi:DNA invertase Pin-like site-specific DNA recombinase
MKLILRRDARTPCTPLDNGSSRGVAILPKNGYEGMPLTPTPTSERLRLALYLRASTAGQLDGYGLAAQEADGRKWARQHGHRITVICKDEAVSGTTDALDREGLSCALGAIREHRADGVVTSSLSRLGRTLTVQEAALAVAWQYGGRVFTVDADEILADDDDDPMRRAMRQMMGVFHDLDRAMIARRLRHGREAKAAAGGYAGGAPAFGMKAEGRSLATDETEMAVLDRMRAWRQEGHSLRAIAARLNAEGVETKRGGNWQPSTVARLLDPRARSKHVAQAARERRRRGDLRRDAEATRLASAAGVRLDD